ncbi:hypothetical protein F4678DRAFT_230959 [Xylaria arbuscula]|nr:hypothetical protein F4678DRAFT_230959 [Xylaria arbuscula]
MEYRNGMNEVYTPGPDTKPVANIIFVHGLFGGPWKTFAITSRKDRRAIPTDDANSRHSSPPSISSSLRSKASTDVYWPRDLLPKTIDNANVYSFGYDADVERFMGATGLNTVHQHGRNLLNALNDLVKEHGPLPLFIVVHSLGGLVVKEALNQSAHSSDAERSKILQITRGVIFLGTPHRGSNAATYGRMAFTLTKIFAFQSANIKLISSLERGSEILDRISTAFVDSLAKANGLQIWSFAEEKEIRLGLVGTHIVPPESAKIGHERENWGTISGDHRQIAKYLNSTDEGFVKVTSVLKGWIDEVIFTVTAADRYLYEGCLKSLDDPQARLRIEEVSQVSRVNRGSFEWLFTERVAFAKWLADDGSVYDPIFWVTGKPGSGKSTLMRFALEDPRSKSLLPPSIGHPTAYFFHLRGKSLVQKSFQGMIQELLYQILKQFPDFFVTLKPIYKKVVSRSDSEVKWDLDELIQGFRLITDFTALSTRDRPRIFLFIDALDENQDQKDNIRLIKVLEEIVERYKERKMQPGVPLLKICLASRPWPLFRSTLGGRSRIPSIAVDEFTTADIEGYTQSLLLKPLSRNQYSEKYHKSVLDLAGKITPLAQGVFVWVRVVVDSLYQHIVDGTSIKFLEDILNSYPSELAELYEYTIRRIPKEYRRETEVALKVVQQSRVQLTLGELYTICLICIGTAESKSTDLPDVPVSWLASRCGGLIETTSFIHDGAHQTNTQVQFIHQTVQDYVQRGIKGLSEIPSTDRPLAISGSQFLAFVCRSLPRRPHLQRIYSDVFNYLGDIEQAMDLASSAQMYDSQHESISTETVVSLSARPPDRDAFGLQAHRPSKYQLIFRDNTLKKEIEESIQRLIGISEDAEVSYTLLDSTPILHNLYYFGTSWLKSRPRKEHADYALIAALGPRLSTSRTDRPRMLSTVLSCLPTDNTNHSRFVAPAFYDQFIGPRVLICDFLPWLGLDLAYGNYTLLALLASAIPNERIDDKTLLKMTEILLSFGASTSKAVTVGICNDLYDMSLLNFVVRFKEGRRDAWIGLLRRHGASLTDEEFNWTNRMALSASLSDSRLLATNISAEESDSIFSAAVMVGLCLAGGICTSQSLARACLQDRFFYFGH